jgi:hypothetical protein
LKSGDPGRNRTDNIQLRRLTLYPIELRGLASVFDYNIMDAGVKNPGVDVPVSAAELGRS